MHPEPVTMRAGYHGSGKLVGKVALITGGDSGIGRAIAVHFAAEGADVAIAYHDEHQDARQTVALVKGHNRECKMIAGDVADRAFCKRAVGQVIEGFGKLDILVNNAAVQYPRNSIEDITAHDLERTFRVNIFAMFHITAAALPYLRQSSGASIINTASVTAYRGSSHLLDYSSTKGAIVSFTRSLALSLAPESIRVNAIAPGPIWTPLIPATFSAKQVQSFGSDVPLGRAGQPWECATCCVLLASEDGAYITGQVIHPNGGEIING